MNVYTKDLHKKYVIICKEELLLKYLKEISFQKTKLTVDNRLNLW